MKPVDAFEALRPSDSDWDLILKGSRVIIFQKDEYIIKEGLLQLNEC
jgi:hypothetical protein